MGREPGTTYWGGLGISYLTFSYGIFNTYTKAERIVVHTMCATPSCNLINIWLNWFHLHPCPLLCKRLFSILKQISDIIIFQLWTIQYLSQKLRPLFFRVSPTKSSSPWGWWWWWMNDDWKGQWSPGRCFTAGSLEEKKKNKLWLVVFVNSCGVDAPTMPDSSCRQDSMKHIMGEEMCTAGSCELVQTSSSTEPLKITAYLVFKRSQPSRDFFLALIC